MMPPNSLPTLAPWLSQWLPREWGWTGQTSLTRPRQTLREHSRTGLRWHSIRKPAPAVRRNGEAAGGSFARRTWPPPIALRSDRLALISRASRPPRWPQSQNASGLF